jgi:cytoskeleton protein RodZ
MSAAMNETLQPAELKSRPVFRPRPDGTIDPAAEAGWFLQRERERRGLELDIVAQLVGIHGSHLAGIEAGDMTRLPARDEALKMIGTYAKYLGFQPEPLVRHYLQFLPLPLPERRRRNIPRPLASAKIIPFAAALKAATSARGLTIVSSISGLALLFGVAAAALQPAEEGEQFARGVDPLPTASVQQETNEGATIKISETPLTDDQFASLPEAIEPPAMAARPNELGDLGAFITEHLDKPPETLGVPSQPRINHIKAPASGEPGSSEARLVLRSVGASVWFRLEDTRGNVVVSRTLRRGESFTVPDRDDLTIIARDGGLISYEIDGVDQGLLGTPGEIVVGRPLSVAKLPH